jgi:hypothetical protein
MKPRKASSLHPRLTIRAFRRPWCEIASRNLGRWLIAIALVYGGAALMPSLARFPINRHTETSR